MEILNFNAEKELRETALADADDSGLITPDDAEIPEEESPETPAPCSWDSASGNEMDEDEETEASEDDPEPPASEPEQTISAGERVSLRDEAFEPLIYACDNQINNALRVAVETGKGFTFTAKISFEAQSGGLFNISHETGYQFDPIKIKNKGTLYEPLRIVLDADGVPIIPYDREHQITLAESMSQTPAATVTADASGVVLSVETEEESDSDAEPEKSQTEDLFPFPCSHSDCSFFGSNTQGVGCMLRPEEFEHPDPEDWDRLREAEDCGCTRDCVIDCCNKFFE